MSESNEIKTFVVLDLETNGLPSEQFNTCAITEISLYAFSAERLKERELDTEVLLNNLTEEDDKDHEKLIPELPRVLHKLTLMINPRRMINPIAESVTGLSNCALEDEAPFDKTTAECLNNFLDRLNKPICMVAHNGWKFDFPVVRYVYDKIKMNLPPSIYCIDSLKAFREIDEKIDKIDESKKVLTILIEDNKELQKYEQNNILNEILQQEEKEEEICLTNILSSEDPLEENSQINWQHDNETTPQRKKGEKHNYQTLKKENEVQLNVNEHESAGKKRSVSLNVRRTLFSDKFKPKTKYPEKGVYKLGNIYKRCFKKNPVNLHRAECDVDILTRLILYYGLDFLAYAEQRKEPFDKVPKLGQRCN